MKKLILILIMGFAFSQVENSVPDSVIVNKIAKLRVEWEGNQVTINRNIKINEVNQLNQRDIVAQVRILEDLLKKEEETEEKE